MEDRDGAAALTTNRFEKNTPLLSEHEMDSEQRPVITLMCGG